MALAHPPFPEGIGPDAGLNVPTEAGAHVSPAALLDAAAVVALADQRVVALQVQQQRLEERMRRQLGQLRKGQEELRKGQEELRRQQEELKRTKSKESSTHRGGQQREESQDESSTCSAKLMLTGSSSSSSRSSSSSSSNRTPAREPGNTSTSMSARGSSPGRQQLHQQQQQQPTNLQQLEQKQRPPQWPQRTKHVAGAAKLKRYLAPWLPLASATAPVSAPAPAPAPSAPSSAPTSAASAHPSSPALSVTGPCARPSSAGRRRSSIKAPEGLSLEPSQHALTPTDPYDGTTQCAEPVNPPALRQEHQHQRQEELRAEAKLQYQQGVQGHQPQQQEQGQVQVQKPGHEKGQGTGPEVSTPRGLRVTFFQGGSPMPAGRNGLLAPGTPARRGGGCGERKYPGTPRYQAHTPPALTHGEQQQPQQHQHHHQQHHQQEQQQHHQQQQQQQGQQEQSSAPRELRRASSHGRTRKVNGDGLSAAVAHSGPPQAPGTPRPATASVPRSSSGNAGPLRVGFWGHGPQEQGRRQQHEEAARASNPGSGCGTSSYDRERPQCGPWAEGGGHAIPPVESADPGYEVPPQLCHWVEQQQLLLQRKTEIQGAEEMAQSLIGLQEQPHAVRRNRSSLSVGMGDELLLSSLEDTQDRQQGQHRSHGEGKGRLQGRRPGTGGRDLTGTVGGQLEALLGPGGRNSGLQATIQGDPGTCRSGVRIAAASPVASQDSARRQQAAASSGMGHFPRPMTPPNLVMPTAGLPCKPPQLGRRSCGTRPASPMLPHRGLSANVKGVSPKDDRMEQRLPRAETPRHPSPFQTPSFARADSFGSCAEASATRAVKVPPLSHSGSSALGLEGYMQNNMKSLFGLNPGIIK